MAKLTVSQGRAAQWLIELANEIYIPMVEELAPIVSGSKIPDGIPEKIKAKLLKEALENDEWTITLTGNDNKGVVSISGPSFTMRRSIDLKKGRITHSFFELGHKLQGKGISKTVLATSVKVADAVGTSRIIVSANLDVGGYTWLRKGFFPDTIAEFLDAGVDRAGGALALELESIVSKMSLQEARQYVLTEDFRRFKDLYLGSSWYGEADVSDPITRLAFTGSANSASYMVNRQVGPASTANEKVMDGLVRHQTYIQRYTGSLRKRGVTALQETESGLRAVILRYTDELEGLSPSSKEARKIYAAMKAEIYKLRAEAWDTIKSEIPEELLTFAKLEQAATMQIINSAFPVVLGLQPISVAQITAIVSSQPFEGRTLKEWLSHNQEIDSGRIFRNVVSAMTNGQTPTQAARAAMGTKALNYKDGQAQKAFRDLESVYLTVTNGIANQVKNDLYEANGDIIDSVMFVATLDIRTTVECAGHDGKIYKRGSQPLPPLHFRCRSLIIPYISPENLNKRGFDANTERMLVNDFAEENGLGKINNRDSLPRGYKTAYTNWARTRKRELIGQVPATQNFDTWLRNQSPTFQNEYLGPGRAAVFRQGNLTLDKFVTRDGYELTIAELTKLSQAA